MTCISLATPPLRGELTKQYVVRGVGFFRGEYSPYGVVR